jgi:hypothetical protein
MSATANYFFPSPDVCSVTDKDGTTILSIAGDRLYSVFGVGSLVWERIATCDSGITYDTIVSDLSAQFGEVPRSQIEHDVERLLEGFAEKGLVRSHRTQQSDHPLFITRVVFVLQLLADFLMKIRLNTLAAFCGLAAVNLLLKTVGFRSLYFMVKAWPVSNRIAAPEAEQAILDAVDKATTWYPKQAMCLQRSSVTTCLLRLRGVPAQMVIGCRKIPFKAHAWVEQNGRMINDKKQVQEYYSVMDRC